MSSVPSIPRAVVLDMGNVLIFHDNARLFRELSRHSGKSVETVQALLKVPHIWEASNLGVLDADGIRRAISEALGWRPTRSEFDAVWNCHFSVHEAVLPVVERLADKVPLVLLSNTNAVHVEFCRRALPILSRFRHLLFSNEVGRAKPDARFYQEALDRLGVPASESVYFDDLAEYVSAAKALGMQGRLFTTAEAFQADLRELALWA